MPDVTPKLFQFDAIDRHVELLRSRGASAEASVAGFGKTYVAAFTAQALAHPLVVICPKVVVPHWRQTCLDIGVPCYVSNYEQFKLEKTGLGHWVRSPNSTGKRKGTGGIWTWDVPKPTMLVFDEAHSLRSPSTQNSDLAIAARRQGIPTLLASASLAVDPLDLCTAGYVLGIHDGTTSGHLGWACRYGVRRGRFTWEFDPRADPTALQRLNAFLFPAYGHRKTYADIPGFPPESTHALPVDLGDKLDEVNALYARIRELETLKDDAPTAVVERLRARQISELAKVPAMVDLARACIEAGQSVPIFVNFKDTLRALQVEFPDWPVIEGGQPEVRRVEAVDRFQRDRVWGILMQIQSGGIGISLHDVRGVRPRHSLISPPEGAIALLQALGRNRRVNGMSPAFRSLLFAAGTVEEEVRRTVVRKLGQIETINDGDLQPLFT